LEDRKCENIEIAIFNKRTHKPALEFLTCWDCGAKMPAERINGKWFFVHPGSYEEGGDRGMKYLMLVVVAFFILCSCDSNPEYRVVQLENGEYTVQSKDTFDTFLDKWEWIGNDGFSSRDLSWVRGSNGLLTFKTKDDACAYKNKMERLSHIKEVIECD
jgi:hypothetical protein